MSQSAEGMGPKDNPPSFLPSASARRPRRTTAADDASTPPSFTPSSPRQTPAAIPPSPQRSRRTAGSSTRVTGERPAAVPRSQGTHAPLAASSPMPVTGRPGATAAARPRRRHMALKIVAGLLAALLLAAGLGLFSAWRWIDGQLTHEDWLTTHADTAAESWLLLGSDERDGTAGGSVADAPGYRTDTILVLTKPKSGASSLISIPRDSLVEVDGGYMKINAVAQLAGPERLTEQVEQITGQKIDHVAKIRFGGLQQVVDALGGVELCYDQTVSDPDSELNWQAGCHMADGHTALAFSRMRYADPQGDFGRAQRQRQVISAIVKKGASRQTLTDIAKVRNLISTGLASVSVDEKTDPLTLVRMALAFRDASGDKGISGSVYWTDPGYYVDGVGSSVLLDDQRNLDLFDQLAEGTHGPGQVGTLAEG